MGKEVQKGPIPVDEARIGDTVLSQEDYEQAAADHWRLTDRILANPSARMHYEQASEEIERHQATLVRVRQARALTQARVAETMGMNQSEVSKLERRSNALLSTLRRFVEATGGELHLVARYPEGEVELLVEGEDLSTVAGGR